MNKSTSDAFLEYLRTAALSRRDGSARTLVATNPPFLRSHPLSDASRETAEANRQLAHTFNWLVTLGIPSSVAANLVHPRLPVQPAAA